MSCPTLLRPVLSRIGDSELGPTGPALGAVSYLTSLGRCEAEDEKRVANYDEIGHRTGPRKKRTLYIADAKQTTGQLITEIQIGQRMLGIIESSARYAQAMETAPTAADV